MQHLNAVGRANSFAIAAGAAVYTIGVIANPYRNLCGLAAFLLLLGRSAGDVVKLVGKPEFRHVAITDLRQGKLVFRGVSRQFLSKPLAEIEWFAINDRPALTAAEEAAARGEWGLAADEYSRTLADASPAWMRQLARLRLLRALDESGQFDRAVGVYIELVRGGTPIPPGCAPKRPGSAGAEVNRAARTALDDALRDRRARLDDPLRRLRFEIQLFEDATAPASDAAASRPAVRGNETVLPGIALTPDSLVFEAARGALRDRENDRALRLLEAGILRVPIAERASLRILLGRARIERGQFAEAADDLMALAEPPADPAIIAEARYYVGLAHERMQRGDVAESMYRQVIQQPDAPAEIRTLAEAGLERVSRQP
jgi:hypothetical protein